MEEFGGIESFYESTNNTTYVLPSYKLHLCTGSGPSKPLQITTYTLIMLSSLIGSSLVVAVFYRNKTLRSPVHYFTANMAISDLILPVIILPWQIVEAFHDGVWLVDGVLGTILCKFLWVAWYVNFIVTIFSMVATAVDRYHAIVFSMRPALISRKRCLQVIGASWISSVIFFAHYFYGYRIVSADFGLICKFQWGTDLNTIEVGKSTWIAYLCLPSLAAIVLTVLYSRIILFLYRQKNNLHLSSEIIKNRAKRNRRISEMLTIIVLVFYVLWITDVVIYGIELFQRIVEVPCLLSWFGHIPLQMVYTVLNPVIYYMFNKNYRQGFRELLHCPWSFSNKCNNCFHASSSPQTESSPLKIVQTNNFTENIELPEH